MKNDCSFKFENGRLIVNEIVSWRANHLKSDGTPEEWEKIAKWCKKKDVRMRLEGRHPDQQKKNIST